MTTKPPTPQLPSHLHPTPPHPPDTPHPHTHTHTAVKNQGQCGSCWAFSATEQIESQTFLDTGVLNVLSPQQIVSCDTVDGGCNGGNPVNAYYYANTAGGVEYESDYPYTSGTTQVDGTCTFDAADVAPNTTPQTYSIISQSPSQEANIYSQIQTTPMSICVDATIWQTYTGGIITPSDACGTSINHAVQLVGIGSSGSTYYIVRNSWSSSWGEDVSRAAAAAAAAILGSWCCWWC
jgi:cathepsin F